MAEKGNDGYSTYQSVHRAHIASRLFGEELCQIVLDEGCFGALKGAPHRFSSHIRSRASPAEGDS